jgi:2-polyprenyl-3-methyl-5-hydroxy-6-metoxy-1,4-benzoquinol methylase
MKNINEIRPYLKGEKFSDQLRVRYNNKFPVTARWDAIAPKLKDKKVIHVGCIDHVPLLKERFISGEWLHQQITDISSKCVGIDINAEGVDYVKKEFGTDNVYCLDITKDPLDILKNEDYDVIILGEVLEHIDNPVEFLSTIRQRCQNVEQIIITVPHIISRDRLQDAHKGLEIINSDHRYWFTAYTLAKIMTQAGIFLTEIQYANLVKLNLAERFFFKIRKILRKQHSFPFYYYRNLIATGKLHVE